MFDPVRDWETTAKGLADENHRLRNAICWALGEGKHHRYECICVLCEDARQLARNDGDER